MGRGHARADTTSKPTALFLKSTRSNVKRNSGKNAFNLLLAALLSGFVSYRFGNLAGCSSSWLTSTEATYLSAFMPIKEEDTHGSSQRRINVTNDRRIIQRTSLPYDCGVVFFFHVPSTGGNSISRWFRKYEKIKKASYYTDWGQAVKKDGSFHPYPQRKEAEFARGMEEQTQNLGRHEWRVAHSHVISTYLNESEDLLNKWRSNVEAQGCQLINAVMFRDPLNHAMSLWKIINHKNATTEEWMDHLKYSTGTGKWGTVLDFFLYNIHGLRHCDGYPNGPGGRNPFNVTKEVKVKRAMELLHQYFDVVTVGNHATFVDQLLNLTGWPYLKMGHANKHGMVLNFTKKEIEILQKMLERNGDIDFIDRVKHDYHGYLAYLDN